MTKLLGALAVVVATLLGTFAPARGASAAGAAVCPPASLVYRVTRVEGAAGTFLIHLGVRTTRASCEVAGYPRLQLVGRAGPLPTHVRHGGLAILNRPARAVALGAARTAALLVAYNGVPGGPSCPQGAALLVGGVRVAVVTRACHGGRLLESPFVAK